MQEPVAKSTEPKSLAVIGDQVAHFVVYAKAVGCINNSESPRFVCLFVSPKEGHAFVPFFLELI